MSDDGSLIPSGEGSDVQRPKALSLNEVTIKIFMVRKNGTRLL